MFFFNLTFAQFATLLASVSGVVVALYLLDRSRRKQTVATLRFWIAAEQPTVVARRKRIQQPLSLLLQLIGILPGLGGLHPYLLSTQFDAWQGFLRTPVDWAPIVRAAWVCALYAVPSVVAAGLVFLRRDVAGG